MAPCCHVLLLLARHHHRPNRGPKAQVSMVGKVSTKPWSIFLGLYRVHMRPMAVNRVTILTRVCADYDSYLKIGPNQKKRGSNCRARQVLFVFKMNDTSFWGFDFYFRECAIGQCTWAWGVSEAKWWGTISLRRNSGWTVAWRQLWPSASGDRRELWTPAPLCRRDFPLRRLRWKIDKLISFMHFMDSVIRVTAIGLICWFILLL